MTDPLRLVRICLWLFVISATATPEPAGAHRVNHALSEIVWQPDTRVLEITHALHLDDALTLLARLGAPRGDLDLATAARLMLYLETHFELAIATGPLQLEPMGAHIDGEALYLYQRSTPMALPQALKVRAQLLADVASFSINQVNWQVGDLVRSLHGETSGARGWLRLDTATPIGQ
jgi:hypothetical protein